jgi:ribosomal-protein-alanine N-acetyltransferase
MMNNIIIRPWKLSDAHPLAAIANNRNIFNNVRNSFPSPYTVMNAIQWISLQSDISPTLSFAIEYNGLLAGTIGCILKEDIYKKNVEIGYFIGEGFWKKGIATKAVELVVNYVQQQFDVNRIYAVVFESNAPSMRVLQKNGFYLESIRRKAAFKNGSFFDDYVWVKLLN